MKDQNVEDNRRYAEERMELLEVIREIVDQEIDAKLRDYLRKDEAGDERKEH